MSYGWGTPAGGVDESGQPFAWPRVHNKRAGTAPGRSVYIGRPGPWGNPFAIGRDGDRDQVVAKYEAWLLAQPVLVQAVRDELAGKHLVCWCKPAACHGDVLLRIANGTEGGERHG